MAIRLKTLGSCKAVAPVFGATAAFTVTAVKLPWEGRDKRGRDENNALSYNLQMYPSWKKSMCVFVSFGKDCSRSRWKACKKGEMKTVEASHLCTLYAKRQP